MTSASELFYQRRSRIGRSTDLEIESDRNFHLNYSRRHPNHYYHHNHNRHDLDGCDPFRRSSPSPHVRHHPDRASARIDQGTSQLSPSNGIAPETLSSTSRERLTGNERLPGAVLLARARLLERLRGVSLSGNRRNSRASFGLYDRVFTFGDDLRVVDGDWGTETPPGWTSRGGGPFTDATYRTGRLPLIQESKKKKPPGLTSEDFQCLKLEIFSSLEKNVGGEVSQASCDCSICLESFNNGDKLIRLPCEHRFHSSCLDPWVRTCGDCPYCRRDIAVSSNKS